MPLLLMESDACPDGEFLPRVLIANEDFVRALFSLATPASLKRNPCDIDDYVESWAGDGESDEDDDDDTVVVRGRKPEPIFFDLCVPKTRVSILRGILETLVGNSVSLPRAMVVELCEIIAVLQASADAGVAVFV